MRAAPRALPPSRAVALAVLDATLPTTGKSRPQDVQHALDRLLGSCVDPRDKRLATELVYGFLRLKGRNDYLARSLLAKPDKTHPQVLRILGLALHELLYLDHVPAHATLSWAVDAARSRIGAFAGSLINGVLRAAQRLGQAATSASYYRQDNPPFDVFCSRFASAPLWLVQALCREYGPETAQRLLEAQLRPAPLGVRVNAARPGARELFTRLAQAQNCLWADFPAAAFASGTPPLAEGELAAMETRGELTRQSAAVHRALQGLGVSQWPGPLFDACAGRGGKTAYLLENGMPIMAASDRNAKRLRGLAGEMRRLNLALPALYQGDAGWPALRRPPVTILLDAPCSGLGVLARRPDAKWKRTQSDVAALARTQQDMLEASLAQLPPGGTLAYLTCTVHPAENARQADWLESRYDLVTLASIDQDAFYDLGEFFWGKVWRKPG